MFTCLDVVVLLSKARENNKTTPQTEPWAVGPHTIIGHLRKEMTIGIEMCPVNARVRYKAFPHFP